MREDLGDGRNLARRLGWWITTATSVLAAFLCMALLNAQSILGKSEALEAERLSINLLKSEIHSLDSESKAYHTATDSAVRRKIRESLTRGIASLSEIRERQQLPSSLIQSLDRFKITALEPSSGDKVIAELELAHDEFQQASSQQLIHLNFKNQGYMSDLWLLVSISFLGALGFSLGVTLFIYRPMVARVSQNAELLGRQNDELERVNSVMAEQADLVAVRNTELTNLYDQLEDQTGTLQNNTEKLQRALDHAQQASEIARFSASRFQELFQGIPVPAFTFDPDGTIYEWNHAAGNLFGKRGFEVFQQSIYTTVFAEDEWEQVQSIVQRVFEGETIQNLEREDSFEGNRRWLLSNFFPLCNAQDQVVGGVCASVDITERKLTEEQLLAYQAQVQEQMSCITEQNILLQMKQQELEEANQRLEGLATTDGLTGLKNHRTFQEELEKQFQSASKSGTPLSLILFDVDKFKMFNDEFGHQAGDEVLVKVALTLRQVARKGEYLARYGGEEFAIVLPNQDAESACETAERFRVALETGDWRHRQVTASFGVSTYRVGMTDRANLVSEADQSLYVSKDAGRNRVSHFDQVETDDVAA